MEYRALPLGGGCAAGSCTVILIRVSYLIFFGYGLHAPRHALFRAKIVIHQISSVPFVGGEFGVLWKFKSVQAPIAQKLSGLLQRVKSRNGSCTDINKGKGREDAGAEGLLSPAPPPTYTTSSSSVSSRSSETAHSQLEQHLSAAAWTSTPSAPSFLDSSNNLSAITLAHPSLSAIPISSTLARGMTPYLKLKDHSVVWSQTLDPILKFEKQPRYFPICSSSCSYSA